MSEIEQAALYLEAKADAIERREGIDPDQRKFAALQHRISADELRNGFHVNDEEEG